MTIVKHLRETCCGANRSRSRIPAKLGRQVQSDEVLAYILNILNAAKEKSTKHVTLEVRFQKSYDLGSH